VAAASPWLTETEPAQPRWVRLTECSPYAADAARVSLDEALPAGSLWREEADPGPGAWLWPYLGQQGLWLGAQAEPSPGPRRLLCVRQIDLSTWPRTPELVLCQGPALAWVIDAVRLHGLRPALVLSEWGGPLPFRPIPTLRLAPPLAAEPFGAVPWLDERGLTSRVCRLDQEQAGCSLRPANELASDWLAGASDGAELLAIGAAEWTETVRASLPARVRLIDVAVPV